MQVINNCIPTFHKETKDGSMNLLEIRKWLIRESGRYELVVDAAGDDWDDNGANGYINAGCRLLDRMQDVRESIGRNFQTTTAGDSLIKFQYCRAIKEVWAGDTTNGRWKLEKKPLEYLRKLYPNPSTSDRGTPKYYSIAKMRVVPPGIYQYLIDENGAYLVDEEGQRLEELVTLDSLSDYDSLLSGIDTGNKGYTAILIAPPADGEYLIDTFGLFYSDSLNDDTDDNYWTVIHPELVIMSSLAMIEKFSRNKEGANDWIEAIREELFGIDKDMADEEAVDILHAGDNV